MKSNPAFSKRHTVSAFDEDLDAITVVIHEMAALARAALDSALEALLTGDEVRGAAVIARDRDIDRLNETVEKLIIQTIALRAPMADDLRYLIAAIRIAALLERTGDHAKSIAKQSAGGSTRHEFDVARSLLREMGQLAARMIDRAVVSFERMDRNAARAIRESDREMNARYREFMNAMVREMKADPDITDYGVTMIMVAKNLERVGDYAANIANSVYFVATGKALPGWDDGPTATTADA